MDPEMVAWCDSTRWVYWIGLYEYMEYMKSAPNYQGFFRPKH